MVKTVFYAAVGIDKAPLFPKQEWDEGSVVVIAVQDVWCEVKRSIIMITACWKKA